MGISRIVKRNGSEKRRKEEKKFIQLQQKVSLQYRLEKLKTILEEKKLNSERKEEIWEE